MTDKQSLFRDLSVQNRKLLFYGVCIWIRALLIYGVWYLWPSPIFRVVCVLALLLTMYRLYSSIHENVWWSKRWHLLTSMILLLLFTTSFFYDDMLLRELVVIVMSTDLLLGIINSFIHFR